MSSADDLKKETERLRLVKEKLKQAIIAEWAPRVDEGGTFFHVFGDPEQTGMAVQLEVGYSEDDEIYVDIQPVSERDDCIDDTQLMELEGVAYSEAHKLDDLVASFAHSIYDFLYGQDHHASLLYTKYKALLTAEQAYKASASVKKINTPAASPKEEKSIDIFSAAGSKRRASEYLLRWENKFDQEYAEAKKLKLLQDLYTHEQRTMLGKDGKFKMMPDNELWAWAAIVVHIARSIRLKAPIFSHSLKNTFVIPAYACLLTHLTECNLSHNQLVVIPQDLTFLPNLRKLYLSFNRIRVLPPLAGCPQLEVLDCVNNEITAFPPDLGSLTRLQTLDFDYNKIVVVPDDIAKLERLQYLGLTKNQVKLIPPQVGTLSNLVFLKLMHNPIVNLPAHIYVQGTKKTLEYLRDYIPEAAHITQSSLVSDLAKFANRELFSDLILRTTKDKDGQPTSNGTSFFAHRIVVDARCPSLYKSTLAIEDELRGIVGNKSNGASEDGVAHLALDLSTASISALPTDVRKRHFDAHNRLVVDVDVSEQEMQYLISYIYGDILEPARPEIIDVPKGAEPEVAQSILAANSAALKQFYAHCEAIAKLAANFKLTRMEQLAKQLYSPSEKVPATTYFSDLQKFSTKPKHSDVAFLVDGRTIPTHKVIICARSEYFNNMLTGGLLESTLDVVPLPDDVRYAVAKSVLEFCYTDDLNCSAETVMDLLMISRVYGIDRLKGMVETIVGYSLDAINAPSIYSIAELYSFKRLRKACRYFILSNWQAVTAQTVEWNELDVSIRTYLTDKAKDWGVI